MKADIRYGTTIHHDSTISKTEVWICDSEEEFWNHYDLIMGDKSKKYTISAEVDVFSISRRGIKSTKFCCDITTLELVSDSRGKGIGQYCI